MQQIREGQRWRDRDPRSVDKSGTRRVVEVVSPPKYQNAPSCRVIVRNVEGPSLGRQSEVSAGGLRSRFTLVAELAPEVGRG